MPAVLAVSAANTVTKYITGWLCLSVHSEMIVLVVTKFLTHDDLEI